MAIRRFKQFMETRDREGRSCLKGHAVSKTLEFQNDGFEVVITITLARQEQHAEAIQFLHRVANELSALEKATKSAGAPRLPS
jgi:hypothetical protein